MQPEIKSKEIRLVDINTIVPNPKNTNRHSIEQIERLSKLIQFNGFRDPLIVSKRSGYLVAGHGRLEAAKKVGMIQVPVVFQDFENEAEEFQFITAHNAIASWAELDYQLIYDEIKGMEDFDIDMLGIEDFKVPDIEDPTEGLTDENDVPDVEETPITKRGDVWLLGEHRVMCGDSTLESDVEKLMNGEKSDITFTSPPYNAGKTATEQKMGKESKYRNDNDDRSDNEYLKLLKDFTLISNKFSGHVFVNIQSLAGNKTALIDYLYELKDIYCDTMIWDKRLAQPAIPKNVLNSRFEYVHIFGGNSSRSIGSKEFRGTIDNVLNIDKQTKNKIKEHNATFPVSLALFFIENFSEKSCLDPFCGSGTTVIACEKINRKCYGMELDEHYCDIIIKRWQEFTGKKAKLESNGKKFDALKQSIDNGNI